MMKVYWIENDKGVNDMNRYTIDRKANGYLLTIKDAPNGCCIAQLVFLTIQEVFEYIDSCEPMHEGE